MKNSNWDYVYCYPDSDVLINKLNIKDSERLNFTERKITAYKIAELQIKPIKGSFDLKHLQKIHKHIFSDIYNWAGKLRTVNISKGYMFHRFDYLESAANKLFSELKSEHYLIGTPREQICNKLAYYLAEINVLHPFREGNGRTQRVFTEYLAKAAGYDVDFSTVTQDEMNSASIQSFDCNYETMEKMFERITKPISFLEQDKFVHNIALPNSKVLEAYNDNSCCYLQVNDQQLAQLKNSGIQFQCVKKAGITAVKYSVRDSKTVEELLHNKLKRDDKIKR